MYDKEDKPCEKKGNGGYGKVEPLTICRKFRDEIIRSESLRKD